MDATTKYQAFISYGGDFTAFAAELYYQLKSKTGRDYYFHPEAARTGEFPPALKAAIRESRYFLLLVFPTTAGSDWQRQEFETFEERFGSDGISRIVPVVFSPAAEAPLPPWASKLVDHQGIKDEPARVGDSRQVSRVTDELIRLMQSPRRSFDDLPASIDARYEKEIIKQYLNGTGTAPPELVRIGYPAKWPDVTIYPSASAGALPRLERCETPLDKRFYGVTRDDRAPVYVDARVTPGEPGSIPREPLAFREAGPRAMVRSADKLKVGVLVSGGIAPGINAVLSGIVERHEAYRLAFGARARDGDAPGRTTLYGIQGGFLGLQRGTSPRPLDPNLVKGEVSKGGSLLTTARADYLLPSENNAHDRLEDMARQINYDGYDILYVIGGEGSMRAAHALWTVYHSLYPKGTLSVIGVPKTMDNDILWVWQSFGFMSAVEKAREVLNQLHTEVQSNPRLAIVQLFGSSSGYVVSHAALGCNACDLALIPEVSFKMDDVCRYLEKVLRRRRNEGDHNPWGLVAMAETAIPSDFQRYVDDPVIGLTQGEREALGKFEAAQRRVLGQTPDELRSAGLKIVSGAIRRHIAVSMGTNRVAGVSSQAMDGGPRSGGQPFWDAFRVLTNEPRHIVRSTPPSVTDVAFGIRLGTMAVDMAMAGYTDCMVSQWLTEYVVVPLKIVVLGRKLVPTEGIFWKTVVSKTGQKESPGLCGLDGALASSPPSSG